VVGNDQPFAKNGAGYELLLKECLKDKALTSRSFEELEIIWVILQYLKHFEDDPDVPAPLADHGESHPEIIRLSMKVRARFEAHRAAIKKEFDSRIDVYTFNLDDLPPIEFDDTPKEPLAKNVKELERRVSDLEAQLRFAEELIMKLKGEQISQRITDLANNMKDDTTTDSIKKRKEKKR